MSPAKGSGKESAAKKSASGVRSMTGFGRAVIDEAGTAVRAEVRSVNHRHLQVKSRLPGELGHLEAPVEGLVRKALERGAVTLTVVLQRAPSAGEAAVNLDVAKSYHKALTRLGKTLDVGPVDLATLVGLPGVLGAGDEDTSGGREEKLVLRAVKEALAALVAMRASEGLSLQRDLQKNAKAVARLVAKIDKRMPTVVREHHRSLVRRANELLSGAGAKGAVHESDLARELALLADRMDVSEEVARIGSHLEQLDAMLQGGGGRRLEFLVQELFREANTIGAKCNDATVAHAVVDLKTHIERLREQVQNVE